MTQKVNAIANGYAILQLLAAQTTKKGVTDIAKATGISPSSCFNILRTFVDLNLATFDETTKGYALGPGIFELARNGLSHDTMTSVAQPLLLSLAQKHNATVGLWDIVNQSEAVLIAMGENSSPARLSLQIGSRQPIGAGATGRANLSMDQENVSWLKSKFAEVTWQGAITFDEYLQEISMARKHGYAIDRDKYYLGIATVSSPFDDSRTGRRYCLTAVLLSGAHDADSIDDVGNDLKSAATNLSQFPIK